MDLKKVHLLTRNFIIELDKKGFVKDLKPTQSKPLDYLPNNIIGNNFIQYVSEDSVRCFKKDFKQLELNKLFKADYKLVSKKNNSEWYKLSFLKSESSTQVYCNYINYYKLQESNEAFKLLAEFAPLPIIGFEYPSLTLNYSNQSVKKEIGFHYSEIQEFKSWHKRILFAGKEDMKQKGKERQEFLENMIKGAFTDGEPLRRTIITKKGIAKRFEINFSPLSKNQIYAFFHDVTDQTNAKIILKENENKLRNIIENLPIPVLSYDITNKVIFANNKQKNLIGKTLNKIKDIKDFAKFIIPTEKQPNSKKIFLETVQQLKSSKQFESSPLNDFELSLNCDDNKIHIFKIRQTIIDRVLVFTFKDITEERNAFSLLEKSEKNFRALAMNMPTAIGAYDINEKIIFLNKHFTKITGYTTKDIPTLKEWYKKSQPDIQIRKEAYNYWTSLLKDHRNGITKNKPTLIRSVKCKDGSYKYLSFLFSIADDNFYVQAIDVTNETIAKNELEKSHQQLRTLADSLQIEIEKERKYISREIHDELGQQITSIKMQMASLWKKTKAEQLNLEYENILQSIDNSIQTVRNISTKLRPSLLDDLGLIAALEWQIKEFTKTTQTKILFKHLINEDEISKENQLHLFRILQESLTNINRHANASKVVVSLTTIKNQHCLSITDNGIGFNINTPTNSMGIVLMKERTLTINGTFDISSIINKGTTIKICIPRLKK